MVMRVAFGLVVSAFMGKVVKPLINAITAAIDFRPVPSHGQVAVHLRGPHGLPILWGHASWPAFSRWPVSQHPVRACAHLN